MDPKEKIILAAAEEFSINSFRVTTMRKISAKAGINHAMINYYFSSKEELYKQVILYLIDKTQLDVQERKNLKSSKEWRKAMYEWILAFIKNVNSPERFHEWKNKIFFREMVDSSNIIPEIFDDYIKPNLQIIINYLNLGTEDEDTVYLTLLSIISNSVFHIQNRQFVRTITGNDFMCKEKYGILTEYILDSICTRLKFRK